MKTLGSLYLIPAALGDVAWTYFLPAEVQAIAGRLNYFIVENARAARAHLKRIGYPSPLAETDIRELPVKSPVHILDALLQPAFSGHDVGLMSDAGCPGVADPGAALIARAHALGIRVVPLTGPSSILLGLMGSGLNGQSFAFHGYLPIPDRERIRQIKMLEEESRRCNRTQIFIETPYRNEKMYKTLLQHCTRNTLLCLACELTTKNEFLKTKSVDEWKKAPHPALSKRPCLFLMLAR